MFELGGNLQEILLILVVALLVVGPKRLPESGGCWRGR
jgi:Sec-independent protein translocase protein TatA